MSTLDAVEISLGLPVFPVDVAASGTRLAGVLRRNVKGYSPVPCVLVLDHSGKISPPLFEYRTIESSFLPDLLSGVFPRSAGRGCHSFDVQCFNVVILTLTHCL